MLFDKLLVQKIGLMLRERIWGRMECQAEVAAGETV
jgi:hypothetical protein